MVAVAVNPTAVNTLPNVTLDADADVLAPEMVALYAVLTLVADSAGPSMIRSPAVGAASAADCSAARNATASGDVFPARVASTDGSAAVSFAARSAPSELITAREPAAVSYTHLRAHETDSYL